MSRRPLTMPPRTTRSFREQTLAVAWVAQRDGGYEADNVGPLIRQKLASEGFKVDQQVIARTMAWLEEKGYAARSVHGRKHRLFVMDPDVDVPEPSFVKAKRLQAGAAPAAEPSTNGAAPTVTRRPPVPGRGEQRPPWLDRLTADVLRWWQNDPTAADQWAADVMDALP